MFKNIVLRVWIFYCFLNNFFLEFEVWKVIIEELNCCSFVKIIGVKIIEKNGEKV